MTVLAMKPTLTGERVRLVPLGAQHADPLHTKLGDAEGRRMTGTHRNFTLADIQAWCASRAEQPDRLDLAIESLDGEEFIGELALLKVDQHNENASFRIACAAEHRGKGYGPEAIGLVLGYCFDVVGLHRVQLDVYDFNGRAIRAYEKCGFQLEGRLREELLWEGERHDCLIMSVLESDWRGLRV